MTYNASAMQDLVRQILAELGENPDREGLLDTPRRVEKSLGFLTSGYTVDIEALINQALFTVDYSEMVIVKDIDFSASASTTCCRSSASATSPTCRGRK